MKLSEVLNLGDKIDIKLTYQLAQYQNGELEEVPEYKSMIMDFPSDHQIEIAMPTLQGRLILFQVGIRCNLFFYTQKGLFTCECTVNNRYKKENLFLLLVDVKSPLTKYQRREFFRVECLIDFNYYQVEEKVVEYNTTEQLFLEIQDPLYYGKQKRGIIKDISGGGIRFSTDIKLDKDAYILCNIRLSNEIMDNTFYLIAKIVSCEKISISPELYDVRSKFLFKDLKDREAVVKFVFEEERKKRRTQVGN